MGVGKTTGSQPWHMKWDITRNFNTVIVNGVEVKEVRIDDYPKEVTKDGGNKQI